MILRVLLLKGRILIFITRRSHAMGWFSVVYVFSSINITTSPIYKVSHNFFVSDKFKNLNFHHYAFIKIVGGNEIIINESHVVGPPATHLKCSKSVKTII